MANTSTPHVVLFPFPAQGHLLPMMKLADLLSHAGLYVTFLATERVYQRCFLRDGDGDDDDHNRSRPQRPRFRFRTVPDGLPKESSRPFVETVDGVAGVIGHARGPYRELLASSRGGGGGGGEVWPPVTCVVADGFLPFAVDVAVEMGVPAMVLRTSSPCSVWAYCCIPEIVKRGELITSPDEANLDASIQGVAGMEGFLRRRDLPGFVRKAKSADDPALQFFTTCSASLARARALVLNTFDSLDAPVLSRLREACPAVYSLGPLHLLGGNVCSAETQIADSGKLWKEDRTCVAWLDAQPDKSVVYVSFGSITVLSRAELLEFWHGLVSSGKRFLWVMRSDLVVEATGDQKSTPLELEEGTRERGCIVGWAPQEEVLAHPSVGCFLTHSGWNSTLESMVAGVPMVCWPFMGDQYTNSRFVSEVWKNGLDMKDVGGRDVVERMVREAMDGEGADGLRQVARKLAEEARESVEEGGSSYVDYQRLVQHIKSLSLEVTDKSYK